MPHCKETVSWTATWAAPGECTRPLQAHLTSSICLPDTDQNLAHSTHISSEYCSLWVAFFGFEEHQDIFEN